MSESALSALYLNIYVMGLGLFKCVNLSVRGGGVDFRRQNLTSVDGRF